MGDEEGRDYFLTAHLGEDGSVWLTGSSSLVTRGTKQPIFSKNGMYYAPFYSSVTYPFARENGYELVVEFPDHHEILAAWNEDGNPLEIVWGGRFQRELVSWYDSLPVTADCSPEELIGESTLARLAHRD